ncbi:tRNA methyltransferase, has a role in tRNA modification [Blastocladiella emersonii ATCC 22665]|nr:tRNA methyltransferase, has a role in tRNA modification [Blastocladiella emersonii ATCC 22665]
MTSLPPQPIALPAPSDDAAHAALEQESVHRVYNDIAIHFSATRYKPWPVVEAFLREQRPGSVGCDVGCGNGKYLGVNKAVWTLGVDRSDQLVGICRERGFDAVVGDALDVPCPSARFDFCISIAVIHHLSSPSRRIAAIREVLRLLRPGGEALVYVWAMEQQGGKRTFPAQDVYVPWHMPTVRKPEAKGDAPAVARADGRVDVVYKRYYHLFVQGELEANVAEAGGEVVRSGYDRDNHYCVIRRGGAE